MAIGRIRHSSAIISTHRSTTTPRRIRRASCYAPLMHNSTSFLLLIVLTLLASCSSQPTATTTPLPWSIALAFVAFLAFTALAGLWVAMEDKTPRVNRRFTWQDQMKPRAMPPRPPNSDTAAQTDRPQIRRMMPLEATSASSPTTITTVLRAGPITEKKAV